MASAKFIAFIAIFLLFQTLSSADVFSSLLDELCKEVVCGKGTCKASSDYNFNFICECDKGWKQTRYNTTDDLRFLPCVIPDCTLNYSCPEAPPPAPEINEPPKNLSFFDPCFWSYCGEGSCINSLTYGHKCECKQGYNNLLNYTAFPCLSDCIIGSDCSSLGITVSNDKAVTKSNPSNDAVSILPRNFLWLTMPLVLVLLK